MTPAERSALARWALGVGLLAATGLLWPGVGGPVLAAWLPLAGAAALAGGVHYLGIPSGFGWVSFLPVATLMAYLGLGRDAALAATTIGLLVGGGLHLGFNRNAPRLGTRPWWVRIGEVLFPIGANGLGLLAADAAFRALGTPPPLVGIRALRDLLPIVVSPAFYLLVYDALLAGDAWLRRQEIAPALRSQARTVLAIQLLPLALAPFAAVVRARLGEMAFSAFEAIVLALAVVVNRLVRAQSTLRVQVDQLQTLTAVNQSLRVSLELEPLLRTVHAQVASLLNVRNVAIWLAEGTPGAPRWKARWVSQAGHRLADPGQQPLDGLTRHVLTVRSPLLAASVRQTAGQLGVEDPPEARTWMGVPLRTSNRDLGCLVTWLESGEQPGRAFEQSDLALLTTIGVQVEMALANALLYEEAQRHAAQLARLNEISTVLNAALNPERLLELVTTSVIEVAGCDRAAIYLLDEDQPNPRLLLAQAQGFSKEHMPRSRDLSAPLTEAERRAVMEQGTAVTVPDVTASEADISPAARLLAAHEGFAAYAYLPLCVQQRMVGMLAVYYDQPHPFSESEIELLGTFANQAALAVVNARIYQQVDIQLARRVGQIVRMSDISQRLSATLDLDTIFKLIVQSAIEGCNADAGVLVLTGDPEQGYGNNGEPHMVAWRGFDATSSLRAPHVIAEELAASDVLSKGETRLLSADDPRAAGPRSHLATPILLEGKVIGALALESERLNAFSQEDLSFVSQLALQAAVAIRNAQLYRHSQIVRDRLHAILDASNDGLLMIDPKGRIVMTNTRMGSFWDFARQDFSPRSPDEFMADPLSSLGEGLGYKPGELSALLKRGLKDPKIKPQTDLYVTQPIAGQPARFVERTAAPVLDDSGQFIGLLLIFRDVTEQKQLEEARQHLTSMIVHELRSPLQAVMGGMRLIAEVMPEKDPIVEQATEVSKRAIKKLLNLVNNLLDLSRMEQGEFVLDPAVVPVRQILEGAAQELMPLAHEMSIVVQVDIPDGLPPVHVDQDMIGRVVLNLLDNALKYADPGSLVSLRAQVYRGEGQMGREMVCLSVADSGPGIPDEYKQAIFDRFAQIPGRRGHRRSAGLGLAFCKLAVESHGGRIWVEDNSGGGSIFLFTLPIAGQKEAAPGRGLAVSSPARPAPASGQPPGDGSSG